MTIGKRIREKRIECGLTLEELGRKIGTGRPTVYKYETGAISNIPGDKIELLAKALGTTPSYLCGWNEDILRTPVIAEDTITFPVIGRIAAGYNEIAVEDWTGETVEIPSSYLKGRKKEDYFVLSVHGNSMYPLYIEGDKVLILKQSTLGGSGEVGAILYDDDTATLKKVEYTEGEDRMKLIPINPEYAPKTIEGADLESCRVIGIPRLLIRTL